MKRILILSVFVLLGANSFAHKYFVSILDMEYKPETREIAASLKCTAHDFEHILEHKFNQRIHIENVPDTSEIGQFVQGYLSESIQVWTKAIACPFVYVGKEVTLRDELFFYFKFTEVTFPTEITIKSTFLQEEFAAQQNIVHYKYKDLTKSVTLVSSKNKETIKFD